MLSRVLRSLLLFILHVLKGHRRYKGRLTIEIRQSSSNLYKFCTNNLFNFLIFVDVIIQECFEV